MFELPLGILYVHWFIVFSIQSQIQCSSSIFFRCSLRRTMFVSYLRVLELSYQFFSFSSIYVNSLFWLNLFHYIYRHTPMRFIFEKFDKQTFLHMQHVSFSTIISVHNASITSQAITRSTKLIYTDDLFHLEHFFYGNEVKQTKICTNRIFI